MRLNKLLLIVCCAIPALGFGQGPGPIQEKLEVGIQLGAAAGLCDIGGINHSGRPWVLDLQPSQIRWDIGAYARYRISKKFSAALHFEYIRVQGFDSVSKLEDIRERNLNYRDDIFQLSARVEWTFYDNPDVGGNFNYTTTFNAYLFGGLGIFHMNPEAEITHTWTDPSTGQTYNNGDYVKLQPLETEGVSYSLFQPSIPLGLGFYYTFNNKIRLGWELCWDKTFTDYIDDVSGTYPKGSSDNISKIGNLSQYMSSQSEYVPHPTININNYENGSPRGNPNNNDAFISTAVTLGVFIHVKAGHGKKGFFQKGNYKSRASF